jgi:outer membrane immunogenic protein
MKFRSVLAAALMLSTSSAFAQDASWTGPYIGAHVGGAWADWNAAASYDDGTGPVPGVFAPGSHTIDGDGWVAGGLIGYNHQIGNVVLGLEIDGSWGDVDGSHRFLTIGGDYGWDVATTLEAFGTARVRVGYAFNNLLIFGTGGVAYGRTEANETVTCGLTGANCLTPTVTAVAKAEQDHVGWTLGAGAEWMFSPGWSLRGEWLHVDLGEADYRFVGTAYPGTKNLPHTTDSVSSDLEFDVFRIGVNYRFGS